MSITRWLVIVVVTDQLRIRRAWASITNAVSHQPDRVDTYVKSATHNRSSASGVKLRLTRSCGFGAFGSLIVARFTFPRTAPARLPRPVRPTRSVKRMRWETKLLRIVLVVLLFALIVGCGLLYLLSLESARNWPSLAHLRLPIYVAVLVGVVPVAAAIVAMFDFLRLVERGRQFSDHTVQILRRIRLFIAVFAAYLVLGLVGFWAAAGMMHATLLFAWFVAEASALFLFAFVALFERLITAAVGLRQNDRDPGQVREGSRQPERDHHIGAVR